MEKNHKKQCFVIFLFQFCYWKYNFRLKFFSIKTEWSIHWIKKSNNSIVRGKSFWFLRKNYFYDSKTLEAFLKMRQLSVYLTVVCAMAQKFDTHLKMTKQKYERKKNANKNGRQMKNGNISNARTLKCYFCNNNKHARTRIFQ